MQKNKKKIHKKIINYMKKVNKNIMNDEYIGLDRFKLDLWSENICRYSDGSGFCVNLIFKISDNITKNSAYFTANNYNYINRINEYANDFLIRCSSGFLGCLPPLNYIAYDVHSIVDYNGRKNKKCKQSDEAIKKWNFTKYNFFN